MSRFRALGAATLATAVVLAGTSIGAAAADPGEANVVIGHGIPSAKVDICVNDGSGQKEIKSDFRFGKYFKTTFSPGEYTFITRQASAGKCKGTVLIRETTDLFAGDDYSVILTKTGGTPVYQIFDNFDLDEVGPPDLEGPGIGFTVFSVKHAAMIGKADVYFSVLLNENIFGDASAPPTLHDLPKGEQMTVPFISSDIQVGFAKAGQSKLLRETPFWYLKPGVINHVVAIGGPQNFRFLRYRTAFPVL